MKDLADEYTALSRKLLRGEVEASQYESFANERDKLFELLMEEKRLQMEKIRTERVELQAQSHGEQINSVAFSGILL